MPLDGKEEIYEELSSFGYACNSDIIDKLYTLALRHNLNAREISDEWIAYIYSNNIIENDLNKEIEAFNTKLVQEITKSKLNDTFTNIGNLPTPNFNFDINDNDRSSQLLLNKSNLSYLSDSENDDLMSIYGITPLQCQKSRSKILSQSNNSIIISPIVVNDHNESLLSPGCGNSQKLAESQASTGQTLETYYHNKNYETTVAYFSEKTTITWDKNSFQNITTFHHSYMNQSLKTKALLINKNIITIADEIKLHQGLNFDYFHPIFLPSYISNSSDKNLDSYTEDSKECNVYLRGRICSQKSDNKLEHSHIFLEGCIDISKGKRIQLNINNAHINYSLFPGQVVIVYGYHDKHEKNIFHVVNIYFENALLNVGKRLEDIDLVHFQSSSCSFIVVAGPFIVMDPSSNNTNNNGIETSNYIKCDFLKELAIFIGESKIKTIILTGPFIKVENDQLTSTSNNNTCIFSQCYEQLFIALNSMVVKLNIDNLILVPSTQDLHTTHIYPIVASSINDIFSDKLKSTFSNKIFNKKIFFSSCPTLFELNNGLSIGITSVDVLHNLSSFELNNIAPSNQSDDRITRLIKHCFHQRNLYPLYPSYQKINLDLSINANFGKPFNSNGKLPHILIMPSNLKHFIKNVNGCIVINPGRFIKGYSLGSYAKLFLTSKLDNNHIIVDTEESFIEIIKI